MKYLIRSINIIGLIIVALLFLSILTSRGYSETIGVAPLFFSDLVLIILVAFGPIILIYTLASKQYLPSVSLFITAIAFFSLAYFNHPETKLNTAIKNLNEVEDAISDLENNRSDFKSNRDIDLFNFRMKELQLFKLIYDSQVDYILGAENQQDIKRNRLSSFCIIFGLWLIMNSYLEYKKSKYKIESDLTGGLNI